MFLSSLALLPTIQHKFDDDEILEKTNLVNETNLVKALHSFKANEEGELEFKRGDLIQVVERNEDGWWKGTLNGREGIFPSNYVDENEKKEESIKDGAMDEIKEDVNEGQQQKELEGKSQEKQHQQRAAFSYLPPGGNLQIPALKPTSKAPAMEAPPQKEPSAGKCGTCGCEEFHANMFRPGHCNNCFHKH